MNDADLVHKVREGDNSAFSELYRAHAPVVYHVVRSTLGGRGGDRDAADVVQDTFVRALERLDSLQSPDRFRPWLLSIARNAATDTLRARSRSDLPPDQDAPEELADPARGPDEVVRLAELTELVRGAVADLAPRDAAAVTMVTQLGYSLEEVAAVFGITHGAAKVLLHRARRRLRDALALQVLVHRRAEGCPELAAVAADDDLAAARHISRCPACLNAASREVQLYAWPPAGPSNAGSSNPTTLMPASRMASPSEAANASGDQSTMANPVTSGLAP